MITISTLIPKGGSGKTTTTICMAFILAGRHNRVLILDCDTQGDTSRTLGKYDPDGIGMSELLEHGPAAGGRYTMQQLITRTGYYGVDIIPGNGNLYLTNNNLTASDSTFDHRLKKSLELIEGEYDYCLIDCGRLLDTVVLNALIASDGLIIPVKTGGYEVDAIYELTQQLDNLSGLLKPHLTASLLMTMRQKNKAAAVMEAGLRDMVEGADGAIRMLHTTIRRSAQAEKATFYGVPLPVYSPKCIAMQDYRAAATELFGEEG